MERKGREPGQLVGRSPWLQPVQLDAPEELIGEIVNVRVSELSTNSLFATLLDAKSGTINTGITNKATTPALGAV